MKKNIFLFTAFAIAILLYIPIAFVLYNILGLKIGDNEYVDTAIPLIGFALISFQNFYFSSVYNFLIDENHKKHVKVAKQEYQTKTDSELSELIWENKRAFDIYTPSGAPCYDRRRELKDSIVYYCELELERRKFVNASRWMIAYFVIAAFSLGYLLGK